MSIQDENRNNLWDRMVRSVVELLERPDRNSPARLRLLGPAIVVLLIIGSLTALLLSPLQFRFPTASGIDMATKGKGMAVSQALSNIWWVTAGGLTAVGFMGAILKRIDRIEHRLRRERLKMLIAFALGAIVFGSGVFIKDLEGVTHGMVMSTKTAEIAARVAGEAIEPLDASFDERAFQAAVFSSVLKSVYRAADDIPVTYKGWVERNRAELEVGAEP